MTQWMTRQDWASDLRRRIKDATTEGRLVMLRPGHAEEIAVALEEGWPKLTLVERVARTAEATRPLVNIDTMADYDAMVEEMVEKLKALQPDDRSRWIREELDRTFGELAKHELTD